MQIYLFSLSLSHDAAHVDSQDLLTDCWPQVHLSADKGERPSNPVVRGNILHHTDGHGPRGIQGEIAQAGTGRGSSMWLPSRGASMSGLLMRILPISWHIFVY